MSEGHAASTAFTSTASFENSSATQTRSTSCYFSGEVRELTAKVNNLQQALTEVQQDNQTMRAKLSEVQAELSEVHAELSEVGTKLAACLITILTQSRAHSHRRSRGALAARERSWPLDK